MPEVTPFESWCIVELFGHQQIAGLVTEATIGGCSFVRVDVPEINGRPAFTKFYGNGAIYSMTPCGEREARLALERIMPRPVSTYLLPDAATRSTADREDDEDYLDIGADPRGEDDASY